MSFLIGLGVGLLLNRAGQGVRELRRAGKLAQEAVAREREAMAREVGGSMYYEVVAIVEDAVIPMGSYDHREDAEERVRDLQMEEDAVGGHLEIKEREGSRPPYIF